MSTIAYILIVFGGIAAYWFYQQKQLKAAGGAAGMLAAADKTMFGLAEGESVAKRWDAMFYLGKLVPETMPGMGEQVLNALTNSYVRGKQIRIALTTTNRVVFSVEPDEQNEPGSIAKMRDMSSAYSRGFSPAASYSPQTPPRLVSGESLFAGHPAWAATVKDAPAANIDPQNYAAANRKMVVARLDNAPQGRAWYLWIDPEAAQFLASWATA